YRFLKTGALAAEPTHWDHFLFALHVFRNTEPPRLPRGSDRRVMGGRQAAESHGVNTATRHANWLVSAAVARPTARTPPGVSDGGGGRTSVVRTLLVMT